MSCITNARSSEQYLSIHAGISSTPVAFLGFKWFRWLLICSVEGRQGGASLSEWLTSSTSTLFSFLRIALGLVKTSCSFSAVSWISCNFRDVERNWRPLICDRYHFVVYSCMYIPVYPQYFIWWWNLMWNCSVNFCYLKCFYVLQSDIKWWNCVTTKKRAFLVDLSIPKLVLSLFIFLNST